jgi:hypothetical protein
VKESEIILFETSEKEVTLSVPMDGDTVWLTQEQMSSLFATARSSIAYHIGNIFKEGELVKDTSVEIFDRSTNNASRPPKYYNLDVIISVGYRVKSKRGIEFRLIVDEDDSEAGFVQGREFEITKERYLKMIVENS